MLETLTFAARRVKAPTLATLAMAGLAVLVMLALKTVKDLDLLGSAQSDNVQWTLSQTEVEFLELELAIAQERAAATPDLDRIREEFDIYYSRVATLAEGELYSGLRVSPQYANALQQVRDALDASVSLIDSADAVLLARLPTLENQVQQMHDPVRRLSSSGLNSFAVQADQQRQGVATTLWQLGLATLVLFGVVQGTSMVLYCQYRSSERTTSRLQTVVGTSLDAIVVSDRDGTIVEFNPAAEEIFGYKRADVLGRSLGETIVPEKYRAMHEAGMARYRETGERRVIGKGRVQLEALRADGTIFPVELSIQADRGAYGELFVSVVRDITQRLEAERELVEARDRAVAGDKAKTEFLAVMSHEMRTPLNGLLGTMSLLQDTRLNKRQRGLLNNMEMSGQLLLRHTNDVLDVTKHDAGKTVVETTDVDLGALVQSVVDNQRDLAATSGSTLSWTWCGSPLDSVQTDPFRLRQVLINLVSNAVKFTQDGKITVEIEAERGSANDATIALRVIDTGIGIDPSDIDRLFRDFETGDASYGRANSGTGLGLAICRRLVEALGGEIGADSDLGQGSVFWVTLPVKTTQSVPDTPAPRSARTYRSKSAAKSVLVIEDNEINRVVLRGHLEAAGHSVTEAVDGREGVAMAADTEFDIILTDISMPHLDGIQATRAIRDGMGPNTNTRIIAVTAHAMPHQIEEFREAGMNGFVSKPIDRDHLQAILAGEASFGIDDPAPCRPDPSHVAELESALGKETLSKLMTRFLSEGDDFAADLSGPSLPCAKVLAQRGHQLAGSASMLGFDHLREVLNDLELQVHEGAASDELSSSVRRFSAAWSSIERPPNSLLN